jgi:hypothetical protein
MVLGVVLECGKAKFANNLTIYTLDDIEAILGNTSLNIYHVDVLRGGSKLRVIVKLANRSISL